MKLKLNRLNKLNFVYAVMISGNPINITEMRKNGTHNPFVYAKPIFYP